MSTVSSNSQYKYYKPKMNTAGGTRIWLKDFYIKKNLFSLVPPDWVFIIVFVVCKYILCNSKCFTCDKQGKQVERDTVHKEKWFLTTNTKH